jgi:hypothetical protein
MLKAGTSTSYRPSANHIGTERLERTLKVINSVSNPNKRITEGLELVMIKKTGTIEEKIEAIGISYKELIAYITEVGLPTQNISPVKPVVKNPTATQEVQNKVIEVDSVYDNAETVTSDKTSGFEMILTMNRNK